MLSDRHYMREPEPRERVSALTWVLVLLGACYVAEMLCRPWRADTGPARFIHDLILTPQALREGRGWTLFTYGLLHDPENFLHLVVNLACIYGFGRPVLASLGHRAFLLVCALAVVAGGLGWAAANWNGGAGGVVGASAAAVALVVLFGCLQRDEPFTFMLLFALPLTLCPRVIALVTVAVEAVGCVWFELLHHRSPVPIAHSAHLGGAFAGWAFYRWLRFREPQLGETVAAARSPRWSRQSSRAAVSSAPPTAPAPDAFRAEVDRILDKISSHGFAALTPAEKRTLDEARELLSRR